MPLTLLVDRDAVFEIDGMYTPPKDISSAGRRARL